MTQTQDIVALIDDYFNLAYEPKSRDFNKIFHPSCLVQWLDEGRLQTMSSLDYAALIKGRVSPQSTGEPRDEVILSMQNISDCLSTATVKVRIGKKLFNDHFVMHKVEGSWLIATKASYLVRTFA
ncbi:nuclear transport factor 2 family protein [Massilia eburnea]|uniref:nuclear transport factor 2 family protein n=1 Tax=Massilia eburnea TaxID=1776165 RepID=UPI003D6B2161